MSDFFKRHVRGVEPPPYAEAFVQVGLRFVREPRQPVSVGISADESNKANFKIATVRPYSPAADAGLEVGDMIALFGGVKLTPGNLLKTLSRYKPGDKVAGTLERGRRQNQTSILLGPPQQMEYRSGELTNATSQNKCDTPPAP